MMECTISTSASTIRPLHPNVDPSLSQQSSPRSSALPSPPDSPTDSVSSFPSVSSSFFFSSAAASPPHSHSHSDHARESTQGLIIPSLTLPSALRRPTPYGQTLGEVKLLMLASNDVAVDSLSNILLDNNEDVVEVGTWEESDHGMLLRASTDWVEQRDAHGLEMFEPSRNFEILKLPGYSQTDDSQSLIKSLLLIIQAPFHSVFQVLNPASGPSTVLSHLVSSPSTPLYTALVFLPSSSPSTLEQELIDQLGPKIPIILLPHPSLHTIKSTLSSFQPATSLALRAGLFRSPETLASLRYEATDRFLRWREVERTVGAINIAHDHQVNPRHDVTWSKAKWESEWEVHLSQDVARRLQENTLTEHVRPGYAPITSCVGTPFDPLHLPSLFVFSLSLLGPVQQRLGSCVVSFGEKLIQYRLALFSGFCVGLGIGLFLK